MTNSIHEHKNQFSMEDVLAHLSQKQLIDETGEKNIIKQLEEIDAAAAPWYIKTLIGVGAWFGALFFLFFLWASQLFVFDQPGTTMIWGIIFIGTAVGVNYAGKSKNVFLEQLALALSTAGHILVLWAAHRYGGTRLIFLISLLLCVLLYRLYRSSIHRFFSCILVIGTAISYILNSGSHHWLHVLLFLEIAAVGFLLAKKWYSKEWRPIGYALVMAVPLMFSMLLLPRDEIYTPWWPSNIILIFALVWLYIRISKTPGNQTTRIEPLVLAVIVTILLGAISSPGILAAAGLLVLGYHLRDKALTGLGLTFLPLYIVLFYYNLNMTLDVKSWILAGSGVVLLGLRQYLKHRPWTKEENQ